MRSLWFAFLPLLFAVAVLGCDTTATQPESEVVVEAYLQAQSPLPTVQLTRTVAAIETFNSRDQAVRSKTDGGIVEEIHVQRTDGNGSVVETTPYSETDTAGVYAPDASSPPTVKPETSYRLEVETDDGTITATTTVPDTLSLLSVENVTPDTTAEYQNDDQQPALTITGQDDPLFGRQSVYLFTVTSLLPRERLEPSLTPFYREVYDAEEDSIESFRTSSSGLLNEGNFTRDDGTITVDLPWIGVAFFGPNEVAINVVDENYFDFLRSESAQENAAPGEFPNLIEHVEGGTGIFGSYAQATVVIRFTGGGGRAEGRSREHDASVPRSPVLQRP